STPSTAVIGPYWIDRPWTSRLLTAAASPPGPPSMRPGGRGRLAPGQAPPCASARQRSGRGSERTARRKVTEVWRAAGDRLERRVAVLAQIGHGGHERFRVGVCRKVQDDADRPFLDDPPSVHDQRSRTNLGDQGEVV